ncbi:MAG: PAS domain S-box protein [Deltaproteobacteria bacterium]|nr:PAS domain S-box protein [Deltaproteobacteria bacterium]MBI3386938.1 PAS domain S-box protein [Deltaproteobacteria bacterium]
MQSHAVAFALVMVATVLGCSAGAGIVRGDATTAPLLALVLTLGIGAVFAWGVVPQLATVAIATSVIAGNVYAVNGRIGSFGHDTILTLAVAMLLSVWIARRRQRLRFATAEQNLTRQRNEAQRVSEERFAALVQHSSDIVLIQSLDGVVRYASPAVQRVLGYSPEQLVGRDFFATLSHAEDRGTLQRLFESIAAAGANASAEFRVRRVTGEWAYLDANANNLLHHPQIQSIVVHARDITDRKRAEMEKVTLLEVARDVTGTFDLSEMLDRAHRRIAEVLPCDAVATYYWDPQVHTFRMLAQHGLTADLLRQAAAFEFRRGLPFVEQLRGERTMVINDIVEQSWIPAELFTGSPITALAWTQLNVKGRALGVLVVFNTHPTRRFEPRQSEMLEGIADHVAVAIETTQLHRAQQQEAEVSAALARVGRELISSLDQPALLDKLCQITTEALACDCSHTTLWDVTADAYTCSSGYGYGAEEWESIRVLKAPRALLKDFVDNLERDEVVQGVVPQSSDDPMASLARQLGLTSVVCMALRRGTELIGFQVAGCRGRRSSFTMAQLRIARGIAQLASFALENARLLNELAHAGRLKSDFVATMSHELRTPLNIIIGYNDLLLDGTFGAVTNEQSDTLRRMAQRAKELGDLINNTLDLSRLEARAEQPLVRQEFSLGDLIGEIDGETRELQAKPGLHVTWRVPPGLRLLYTDATKLKLVVKNLIVNALKFTEHGSVAVTADARDGGVELCVTDTGIGIPPEALPVIFEPFRQVDGASLGSHSGVGLGLYIVRRFLDLLGGTIAVHSQVGAGSTFRVWIPHDIRDTDGRALPSTPGPLSN